MNKYPVLSHSLGLWLANLISIAIGFAVYHVFKSVSSIPVQGLAAAAVTMFLLMKVGKRLIAPLRGTELELTRPEELVKLYVYTLLWTVPVGLGLHYLFPDLLTWVHLLIILGFQIFVNMLFIAIMYYINTEEKIDF